MVAVKASDVAGALRRPDPRIGIYLLYGPDAGLVAERARLIAERSVDDPSDPFQLVRLDGDVIASDPARLADEAGTMGLFGGKRALWIKATSRNLASAVEPVLAGPLADTVVVIEAGELQKSSPLRTLCERSPRALALPCYEDSPADLAALVTETLKASGLAIGPEARAALLASLGGDRLATRGELAKLALYAHGQSEVTVADVEAVLSDVSGLATDAVIDAAFGGDRDALEIGVRRLAAEGVHASVVLGAALRHAFALLPLRIDVEAGKSPGVAVESWRGLYFKRKDAVQRQLKQWTSATLRDAIRRIQEALYDTRRLPNLDDTILARTFLQLAQMGRPGR
ncbi:MAG TPA: DNA polymerase III subunit delta [Microvirga sp.]|jgi:DNA polymerase-3 subunit delta